MANPEETDAKRSMHNTVQIDCSVVVPLYNESAVAQDADYEKVQNLFSKNLKIEVKLFNEYHALIVRLAKVYCLKNNPKCDLCPVKK